MIDGKTKLVAIFGDPLTYTLSPRFQNEGFAAADLNWVYLAMPASTKAATRLWSGLSRAQNFMGANVTIPHKQLAMRWADQLTAEAKGIGAVNTLFRRGKRWIGHNTDAGGFVAALKGAGVRSLRSKQVLLLGAGGSARAIAWACAKQGASTRILARRPAQARRLAKGLAGTSGGELRLSDFPALAGSADLIVNTVPDPKVGKALGLGLGKAPRGGTVMDITYDPPLSPLLKAAKRARWKVVNGLPMLLEQGMLSFQCWTGKRAPRQAMQKSLKKGFVS